MAKVSHPREEQFILDLISYYRAAELNLIRIISEKEARGTVTAYSKSLLAQVQKQIDDMNKEAVSWSTTNLPPQYEKGIKSAVNGYSALGVEIGSVESFSKLNTRNIAIIVRNTTQDLVNANNFIGRKIADDLRQAGLEAIADKELTGQTVKQTKQNLINNLIDTNVMTIKTRNGRNMNISSYAEVVARSTSREAQNRGLLDTVTTANKDLVKMSSHLTTCPVCGPLQGRVYSISGNSTEYPPLEIAHGGVHANIHPNCRHVLMPYVPELDEDAEKVKAFSNRSFDIDSRSKSQIDNYNREQKKKAELNRDRRQWERYKTMMPDKTPKTLSAFRKSKKSNSENWQELQSEYRSLRQTEAIYKPKPKPRKTVPKIEDSEKIAIDSISSAYERRRKDLQLDLVPAKEIKGTNVMKVDFNGIDKSIASESAKIFNKLSKKYYTSAIRIEAKSFSPLIDAPAGTVPSIRTGSSVIEMNNKLMGDRKQFMSKMKKAVESGHFPNIPESEYGKYVMTHEFAHTLLQTTGSTKNFVGLDVKNIKNARKDISKIYDNYKDEIGMLKIQSKELSDKAIMTMDDKDWEKATIITKKYNQTKISEYANFSKDEFMAEAFTESQLSETPSRYSVEVEKVLKKYFGR